MRKKIEPAIYSSFKKNVFYPGDIQLLDYQLIYQSQFSYFLYQLKTKQPFDIPACWKIKQWDLFFDFSLKHIDIYKENFHQKDHNECRYIHIYLLSKKSEKNNNIVNKI